MTKSFSIKNNLKLSTVKQQTPPMNIINKIIFFILPIYYFRFSFNDEISFNFLQIILIIAIIINSRQKQYFKKLKNKKLIPLYLLLAGFLASYLYNQTISQWQEWSNGLGKMIDLLFLPIIYIITLPLKPIQAWQIYQKSARLLAIVGLFYFFNHNLTFDNRLNIFYDSPNQLAFFLSPAILWEFLLFLQKKKIKNFFFFIVIGLNIFFTKSLGAYLSLPFSITFLILTHFFPQKIPNTRRIFSGIIMILTLMITIGIINTPQIIKLLKYQPKPPFNSYDSRLIIYQVNQKILHHHWLLGIGPGSFQKNYLQEQKNFPPYPQWAVPHCHNNLIHFWIEGGIVAGLCLLFLYFFLLTIPISKNSFRKNRKLLITQQAILYYFILHGIVDTSIWTNDSAILFWLAIISQLKYLQFQPPKTTIPTPTEK